MEENSLSPMGYVVLGLFVALVLVVLAIIVIAVGKWLKSRRAVQKTKNYASHGRTYRHGRDVTSRQVHPDDRPFAAHPKANSVGGSKVRD